MPVPDYLVTIGGGGEDDVVKVYRWFSFLFLLCTISPPNLPLSFLVSPPKIAEIHCFFAKSEGVSAEIFQRHDQPKLCRDDSAYIVMVQ